MRNLLFIILFILVGCNGSDPKLSPLSNIQITPPPETNIYSLSVYASNLAGSTLTLNNGTDSIVASADGSYVFPGRLAFNDAYNVTASSATMNCSVKNGLGTAKANVGNIEVKCAPQNASYIQGAVQGFSSGSIVVKLLIGGVQVEQKTITPDLTSYSFSNYIPNGSQYAVSVVSKPSVIDCNIESSTGTITENLNDINLICNPSASQTYTVSGLITGLPVGKKLTLWDSSNNIGNETAYTGTGTDQSYSVTNFIQGRRYILELAKSDSDVHCYFANGTYKTAALSYSNVNSINITCRPRTIGACGAFTGELPYHVSMKKIICDNDQVYMAGSEPDFGKYLGAGWSSEIIDNVPSPRKTFDRIRGYLNVVTPDGSGGWYIGGSFTYVGDVAIKNIAHIFSDLTLDETFKVNVPSPVSAIARKGFMLYIGGSFTSISVPGTATLTTKGLAALDLSTSPYSLTNLSLNFNTAEVSGIALTDTNLIINGEFRETASSPISRIEKVPLASSLVSTVSNPYLAITVFRLRTFKGPDGNWSIFYSDSTNLNKIPENSSTATIVSNQGDNNWDFVGGNIYVSKTNGIAVYNPVTLASSVFSPLVTGIISSNRVAMYANSTSFCLSAPSFTIAGTVGARKGLACFNVNSGTILGNSSNLFPTGAIAMSESHVFNTSPLAASSATFNTSILKYDLNARLPDAGFANIASTSINTMILDGAHLYYSHTGKIQRLDKITGMAATLHTSDSVSVSGTVSKMLVDDDNLYAIISGKLYRWSFIDGTFTAETSVSLTQNLLDLEISEGFIWRWYLDGSYKMSTQPKDQYGTSNLIAETASASNSGLLIKLTDDRIISGNKVYDSLLVMKHSFLGQILGTGADDLIYRLPSAGNVLEEVFTTSIPTSTPMTPLIFTPKSGFLMGSIYDGSLWQFSNINSTTIGWYNTTDTHPYVKVMRIDP